MGPLVRIGIGAGIGLLLGKVVSSEISQSTAGALRRAAEALSRAQGLRTPSERLSSDDIRLRHKSESFDLAIDSFKATSLEQAEQSLADAKRDCATQLVRLEAAQDALNAAERQLEAELTNPGSPDSPYVPSRARQRVSLASEHLQFAQELAKGCPERVQDLEAQVTRQREELRERVAAREDKRRLASAADHDASAARERAIAEARLAFEAASQRHEDRSMLGKLSGVLVGLGSCAAIFVFLPRMPRNSRPHS